MEKQLRDKLEELAESLVMTDVDDAEAVGEFSVALRAFADMLDQSGAPEPCAKYTLAMADSLAHEATESLWEAAGQLIAALQGVIRDDRSPADVSFPKLALTANPSSAASSRPVNQKSDELKKTGKEEEMQNRASPVADRRDATRDLAGKYLTFKLAEEEYGLEILKVREIIKMMKINKVPRLPSFVRGVINLRGNVIPVMDLRLKFDMPEVESGDLTCIIVVRVTGARGTVTTGLIVDEVSEVMDITKEQIEPAPEFGASVDTGFILGMAKCDSKVVVLLDVDRVLSAGEIAVLDGAAGG